MKRLSPRLVFAAAVFIAGGLHSATCSAAEQSAAAGFRDQISSILEERCYQCHGYGEKSGGIAFDELKTDAQIADPQLWWRVLKNVRAGVMPPLGEEQPSDDERQKLEHWIKYAAFGLDPKDVDPGRVTIRRLNRLEYRNTIRDLLGIDFNTQEEFSPDDTGYGFDNIGEVLSISPLLLEKYMDAAEAIVAAPSPAWRRWSPNKQSTARIFAAKPTRPIRKS